MERVRQQIRRYRRRMPGREKPLGERVAALASIRNEESYMVELSAMVADGKLKPRVTGTYPLDRFADAFAAITERRAQGKIVLTMD